MTFDNYLSYTTPTAEDVIAAGDSTLIFDFAWSPPEGTVFISGGYRIDPTLGYQDETFFVPWFDALRHDGATYNLSLRRCGPIPKQDFTVRIQATIATIS
jgi:hypothetical protein